MTKRLDLHQAVAVNDITALRIICTKAYDTSKLKTLLETTDEYGNTPLLKACYLSRYSATQELIDFGANLSAVNFFGQNALTLATYAGSLKLVNYLLSLRSYHDFTLSSIIPPICVAAMCKHHQILNKFKNEDLGDGLNTMTAHGLTADCIRRIFEN